jgi:hypothetical protein
MIGLILYGLFFSGISSLDLCPEMDAVLADEKLYVQKTLKSYNLLLYHYTVCDTTEYGKNRVEQLMLDSYRSGGVRFGVTILSQKFSKSAAGVCKETIGMRDSILMKRKSLSAVDNDILDEMGRLCRYWGSH